MRETSSRGRGGLGMWVEVGDDPGKDWFGISGALMEWIAKVLEFPVASMLPEEAFTVVRKSLDARKKVKEPKFVYTVDMDVRKLLDLQPRAWEFSSELKPEVWFVEHISDEKVSMDKEQKESGEGDIKSNGTVKHLPYQKPRVGSGPSGLFATLVLAELGADVTLIERGQPVEQRGRDIGAFVVRLIIQSESNFCYGEVLKTLVRFGAPENILVDGKPHLGTDSLGLESDDLLVEGEVLKGVTVSNCTRDLVSEKLELGFDAVVLGVGHSARDVYEMLLSHNVELVPKDFAVGLRVEHPQELINRVQYSALAAEVRRGRGKLPVADYKVSKYVTGKSPSDAANYGCYSFCMCPGGQIVLTSTDPSELCINGMSFSQRSGGPIPTSSYRVGVKPASLHELFPSHITKALQDSIATFESETTTSSPVQIPRDVDTYESLSLKGLYPIREGAGYASGIVSAAVDGMYAGLFTGSIESVLGKAQNSALVKY
ncbi:hypothetical protein AKJ16_DCAP08334 [Drosera capensis]